jgi:hypothetical protein
MRRLVSLFILFSTIIGTDTGSAQGSAEYYFPLRVGNYWAYHTDGVQNFWSPRTTRETIDGTDLIGGQQYVRVKGVEILDENTADTVAFHVFWLRQDIAGNILMGAFTDGITDVASALRFDPPMPFFPNEFLNAGYSREYFEPTQNTYSLDSVESTTETVSSSAGSFTDCIKIRNQQKDAQGVIIFLEHVFYARGVGEVKRTREVPVHEVHVNHLVQYSAVTSVGDANTQVVPDLFVLQQNYPNPFNPSTTVQYALAHRSHVTLTVFNTLGEQVAELVNGEVEAGHHTVQFDASGLATGVYFYRMQAGSFADTKKLLLVR